MARPGSEGRTDRHEIVFALLMLVFVATLIYQSFGLTRSPRLLPQLVGTPTLLLLVFQLLRYFGLVPVPPSNTETEADEEGHQEGLGDLSVASLAAALDEKQREEGHGEETIDKEAIKRMVVFILWSVGLVVGAALTSFLIVIPLFLFGIIYHGTRRLLFSTLATMITYGFIWFIFDSFLGVRF